MLSAVIRSALGYTAYTVGTITGTPAVRPSRSSRTRERSSQCSNACTGYGPNCLTHVFLFLPPAFGTFPCPFAGLPFGRSGSPQRGPPAAAAVDRTPNVSKRHGLYLHRSPGPQGGGEESAYYTLPNQSRYRLNHRPEVLPSPVGLRGPLAKGNSSLRSSGTVEDSLYGES